MSSTGSGQFGKFLGLPDLVQDKARKEKFFFYDDASTDVHISSQIEVWCLCGSQKVKKLVHLASRHQEVPNQPFFH